MRPEGAADSGDNSVDPSTPPEGSLVEHRVLLSGYVLRDGPGAFAFVYVKYVTYFVFFN